jgi:hypothetical protein
MFAYTGARVGAGARFCFYKSPIIGFFARNINDTLLDRHLTKHQSRFAKSKTVSDLIKIRHNVGFA